MSGPTVLLLPGLHGTANLFDRFVAAAPTGTAPRIQPLPNDHPLDYEQLTEWVVARLPPGPVVLIAESFSGPLALFVAAQAPSVAGIALCVTFIEPPAPRFLARVPSPLFGVTPPVAAIAALLTGGEWSLAREARNTVRDIPAGVIACRISSALRVDARAALRQFAKPLLCISATRDRIVPARCASAIRALKPAAEFVEIDGPHMLLQARAQEVWGHISAFLERFERPIDA